MGSGRKRGSPNKVAKDIREALASYSPAAQAKLVALLDSEDDRIALAAAKEILDRVHGKAGAIIETDKDDGRIEIVFTS